MEKIIYPIPNQNYMVLVRCFTFNHSHYIEDALNGFAMQQTNFPFVCLVMDDASTDGEQDVIKAWMERECDMSKAETIDIPTSIVILVPHKINQSCSFAFYLLKQNLNGARDRKMGHVYPWREKCKYEAMCEGDDYWTDSQKLQKQVDFLESHPDYVMCSHRFNMLKVEENIMGPGDWPDIVSDDIDYDLDSLIHGKWYFQPMTVVYRCEKLDPIRFSQYPLKMDAVLFFHLLQKGKGYMFSDIMAVYRRRSDSVWAGASYGKKIKTEFNARIGIYNVDKNYEAAFFLRNQFTRWIPRRWAFKEWQLMLQSFRIISKYFGFMPTLKLFVESVLLGKKLKY